jgi:hypothetical protein
MSDFYQIKIAASSTPEGKQALIELGLSDDYWVIRNAVWVEDYLDLDQEGLDNHIAVNEAYGRQASVDFVLDLEARGLVHVRQVPALIRRDNFRRGYIVSDDIANHMTSEIKLIGEEGIPPNSGEALNWFAKQIEQFVSRSES